MEPGRRSERMIPARWVDAREETMASVVASALGLLAFALLLADDWSYPRFLPLPHGAPVVAVVGPLFALVAFAPWLRRKAAPRRANVRVEPASLRIDERVILASDVRRVSVAAGARGASVGWIGADGRPTFLEVERRDDADAIARALGGRGGAEDFPLRTRPRWLAPAQLVAALAAGAGGLVNAIANLEWVSSDLKIFGLVPAVAAPFLLVLAVLRRRWAGCTVPGEHTAFDAHAALHAAAAQPAGDAGASEASDAETADRRGAAATVLGQNGEAAAAWLARLDSLPKGGSAYRGASLDRDALRALLADESAPADLRAAAARLLALRFEEPKASLVRVVADPEVRLRVEVAAYEEDPEDAGVRLEALGPLFRAR